MCNKKSSVLLVGLFFNIFCFGSDFKIITKNHNLVDLEKINKNVILDIRYATKNNIVGFKMYSAAKCYLRAEVAKELNKIQKELKSWGLGLKVWDGFRPFTVQELGFKKFPNLFADPKKGGRHTRGTAVDLTLIDLKTGKELEMPSEFDSTNKDARRDYEFMSKVARKNMEFLTNIMIKHGFSTISNEWWHFDYNGWQSCPVVKVDFDTLE